MKLVRYAAVLFVVVCATVALAESGARTTFDALKALEGTWEGKNSQGQSLKVTFRETAGGSALLSEILGGGHENMVSMIHMDGDRLLMTHYCGAGNQPSNSTSRHLAQPRSIVWKTPAEASWQDSLLMARNFG